MLELRRLELMRCFNRFQVLEDAFSKRYRWDRCVVGWTGEFYRLNVSLQGRQVVGFCGLVIAVDDDRAFGGRLAGCSTAIEMGSELQIALLLLKRTSTL